MTHGAHRLSPKLIAPRIGTETRSPLLPSCLYSVMGRPALVLAVMTEYSRNPRGFLKTFLARTLDLIMGDES